MKPEAKRTRRTMREPSACCLESASNPPASSRDFRPPTVPGASRLALDVCSPRCADSSPHAVARSKVWVKKSRLACWQCRCRRGSGAAVATGRVLQGGRDGARQSLVLILRAGWNGRQKGLACMSPQEACMSPQSSSHGLVLVLPRSGLVVMRRQRVATVSGTGTHA